MHFQNSSLMNEDKRCRPILFHSEGQDTGDQVVWLQSVANNNYKISGQTHWSWPLDVMQILKMISEFEIEYGLYSFTFNF